MRTAGVDLAAESKGTALAVIEWDAAGGTLVDLRLGVTDAMIVEVAVGRSIAGESSAGGSEVDDSADRGSAAAAGATTAGTDTLGIGTLGVDKLGIDCAFGWPDEFVEFVRAHADVTGSVPTVDGGMEWRRTLAYRATDRYVKDVTKRWPLSVSTDRLGLTAMRCAGLLGRLAEAGFNVDRAGEGLVAEVYPGANLRLWGFDTTGYRVDAARRRELLGALNEAAPWLDLGAFGELMVTSGDAFDAVAAALGARASTIGLCTPAPAELRERAQREGWIALPSGSLGELLR